MQAINKNSINFPSEYEKIEILQKLKNSYNDISSSPKLKLSGNSSKNIDDSLERKELKKNSVELLDPILELYVEQDRTAAEIIALGFDEALVRRISRLVDVNEYKRRQGPPGVRVSLKAFGKDRRLPITNAYRG